MKIQQEGKLEQDGKESGRARVCVPPHTRPHPTEAPTHGDLAKFALTTARAMAPARRPSLLVHAQLPIEHVERTFRKQPPRQQRPDGEQGSNHRREEQAGLGVDLERPQRR